MKDELSVCLVGITIRSLRLCITHQLMYRLSIFKQPRNRTATTCYTNFTYMCSNFMHTSRNVQ